jgi:GT2 family glycosyltransferase
MFSIIVPVKAVNNYIRELIPHIQSLSCYEWELIIVPNELEHNYWADSRIRFLSSGHVSPARKRDLGALHARGAWLYFLDDDSYPAPNVLEVASNYINDPEVVGLGGPAITPANDTFWQKVSGAVFLSRFSGGNPSRYRSIGGVKAVDDWPSVNLMIKKEAFLSVGGFNSDYWPGEDTKLCLDLIKSEKKILYIPNMIVWHHRREGFLKHLYQVGAYGLHRGFFAKKFPENSRKLRYFMPSLLVLYLLITIIIIIFTGNINKWFAVIFFLYIAVLFKALIDISKFEGIKVAIVAILYVVATHFWYGLRFIQGFSSGELKSKLR